MKKFLLITLCVLLCACLCMLASCTKEETNASSDVSSATSSAASEGSSEATSSEESSESEAKTYTFTVLCGDTNEPVEGVRVQMCQGDFCMMPVATNSDGVCVYSLGERDYDVYDVHIIGGIPEGYAFDNTLVKTNAENTIYTLTLQKVER